MRLFAVQAYTHYLKLNGRFWFTGALFMLFAFLFLTSSFSVAEDSEPVLSLLSDRHGTFSKDTLLSAAGDEDKLVSRLLELRNYETIPYVSIRAEKLLLEYADRSNVRDALMADLANRRTLGLARIIAANLDHLPRRALRLEFSEALLRNTRAREFAPLLLDSKDKDIASRARAVVSR